MSSQQESHQSVKKLFVLGSTGSIGCQTLDLLRANPQTFAVIGLAAGSNLALLSQQIREFKPRVVSVADEEAAKSLRQEFGSVCEIISGALRLEEVLSQCEYDAAIAGISGFSGVRPALAVLRSGRTVLLANKEAMVCAPSLLWSACGNRAERIIPLDSEHSSLYQCLYRRGCYEDPLSVTITATGGPFWQKSLSELKHITPEQAANHPRWSMGVKISIDSATLMNKALEVIEAAYLFRLSAEKLSVLIHPECVIHGIVDYSDGSSLAALFNADMRVPIGYGLRKLSLSQQELLDIKTPVSRLDLRNRSLSFHEPDWQRFPALRLASEVLNSAQSQAIVLNAANEEAVKAFQQGRLGFVDIVNRVEDVLNLESPRAGELTLEEIEEVDAKARERFWSLF